MNINTPITVELQTSINRLYSAFARYKSHPTMEACPCCVSDADKALLHSKPLHQLTDHELRRYTSKAMTTWGDTDDFKHFLPRILELVSLADFSTNAHTVLGKLQYGNWSEWPKNEQERVNEFLLVWWTELVSLRPNFDGMSISEIPGQVFRSIWGQLFRESLGHFPFAIIAVKN